MTNAPENNPSEPLYGNLDRLILHTRETWGRSPAHRLVQDARDAIRGMRRNPGYTCTVVLTLALGIGLNAVMYGMLSRLFLQPPPHVEDPEGIHRVWVRDRGDTAAPSASPSARDRIDWAHFAALHADADRFAAGGYTAPRNMYNGHGQTAEELQVSCVTGNLFARLGTAPALGRAIGPEDDDVAAPPVAVDRQRLLGTPLRRRPRGPRRHRHITAVPGPFPSSLFTSHDHHGLNTGCPPGRPPCSEDPDNHENE